MAPSRRQNGRSPLVNKQSQITTFFTKASSSSSPTPSPSPSSVLSKQNPARSRSPSPIAPSPLQSKLKKPLLVIGSTPSPPRPVPETKSYGQEVVGKRIRVYWPLDKSWYEGLVQCFDESTGKHLVQYDDADEEALDLGNEKIEWVEELGKSFKRLRRSSSTAPKAGSEEKNEEEPNVSEAEPPVKRLKRPRRGSSVVLDDDESGGDDDSGDEDWVEKLDKEGLEDGEDQVMDLEDEAETQKVKGKREHGRHEKVTVAGKLTMGKKNKSDSDAEKREFKVQNLKPINDTDGVKATNDLVSVLTGDSSERFKAREAEKFPFLGSGVRDANRRCSSDANYDPRTLYLPPDFLKSLTGGQRQWWEFKAKHMDKVLFFKMGKFYELFEMDAHVGAKELDLQYMKGEQPHCGFPEKNFSMNIEKLARKGYRVLVIEQTETPEQLEARRREKGVKDKVVKREVCAVVTKGTLTEGEMLSANPDASYLMAVTESCQSSENKKSERIFGVCVVDVATSRIILGQFMDDSECSALCCLLSELRPVEIIKPAKQLSPETEKVLVTHTRSPLVNELVPMLEFWDADKTVSEVKSTYKRLSCQLTSGSSDVGDKHPSDSHIVEDELHCLPVVLSKLVAAGENSFALSALGGALYYLKQAFLHETLLQFAKFELLPCSGFSGVAPKPYMVLDAAALENLEVFENSRNGGPSGTIYAQLNHCVTAFGKRLLRKWLARPLYHVEPIKERQDAVAGLKGQNLPFTLEFRKTVSRLQDMERLLARIFASSEANGRNADKVVLYEDAPKKKLQEFISALRGCELMAQACSSLGLILENTESRLLHHLLTPGKGLPDIHSILKHFKDAFDWVEASNSGRIMPCEGVDMEYDSSCEKIKEIKSNLTKHLKEQKTLLGNASITYVTVGKDEYLLEVPESMSRTIPRDYELRSSKKGFYRYWTPSIKKLLGELSQAESEKESTLRCILQRLIGQFCEHHTKWRQLVSATAELDVFITLAIASEYYEGPTCRPVIIDSSCPNEVPHLSAKTLGHPVLRSHSLGKGTFVPNDISIGGSDQASFILLTGPNMGGKSTLLRQVCLAVILAQLGADVPAESFEMSPVDRIFVRMGAKDHIMAGQSTFLTEVSETSIMLSKATSNSLVVLDELGRGTATSDGQAIAESVLNHLVHTVRCRGMFSTHYHKLAMDYEKDPLISLCHMASQIGNTVDGVEEVVFLYRLTSGICPKSYGVNVARLAGIPNSVLQKAAAKSREFEAMYGKRGKRSTENLTTKNRADEMVALIKKLVNVAASISCHEPSNDRNTRYLTRLQQTARALQNHH